MYDENKLLEKIKFKINTFDDIFFLSTFYDVISMPSFVFIKKFYFSIVHFHSAIKLCLNRRKSIKKYTIK